MISFSVYHPALCPQIYHPNTVSSSQLIQLQITLTSKGNTLCPSNNYPQGILWMWDDTINSSQFSHLLFIQHKRWIKKRLSCQICVQMMTAKDSYSKNSRRSTLFPDWKFLDYKLQLREVREETTKKDLKRGAYRVSGERERPKVHVSQWTGQGKVMNGEARSNSREEERAERHVYRAELLILSQPWLWLQINTHPGCHSLAAGDILFKSALCNILNLKDRCGRAYTGLKKDPTGH